MLLWTGVADIHCNDVHISHLKISAFVDCRKQFPALPTMTQVIPAWQLQGNSAEKSIEEDNATSRVETKSTTAFENSENPTDTKLLVTAAVVEPNQQSRDSVKDKLDHSPSEIVQVSYSCA